MLPLADMRDFYEFSKGNVEVKVKFLSELKLQLEYYCELKLKRK